MDNQTVSSHYVALQPPYKIIKHGYKIGVQIGTQRVIIAGGNPFRTETHDYPVVAADNRIAALKDYDFNLDGSCDGEVWDNVETKNVSVLCDAGISLEWQQFIQILWHDHARLGNPRQPINKVYIFRKIISYIKSMTLPPPGFYTLHLRTEASAEGSDVVRTKRDDEFALNVEWSDNLDELENRLIGDKREYLLINSCARFWKMRYETEENRLQPLVERLNANPSATSFHNQLMSTFTISCLPPYEKKEPQNTNMGENGVCGEKPSVREITWDEKKQCFKAAVLKAMEKKKKDGNYLFGKNSLWKAVYRFAIDSEIMYDAEDPKKPQDTSSPQYTVFQNLAQELQLDDNTQIRIPFTKNAIDEITKKNYARYNAPYRWSYEGITDPRTAAFYMEMEDVYLALQEEYESLCLCVVPQ